MKRSPLLAVGQSQLGEECRTSSEAGGTLEKVGFSGCRSPRPSWGLMGSAGALRLGVSGRYPKNPEPPGPPLEDSSNAPNRAGTLEVGQVPSDRHASPSSRRISLGGVRTTLIPGFPGPHPAALLGRRVQGQVLRATLPSPILQQGPWGHPPSCLEVL